MKIYSFFSRNNRYMAILTVALTFPAMAGTNATSKPKVRRNANRACTRVPGYKSLISAFDIEDSYAGHVNSMPESLFVKLKPKHPSIITGIWWWNPLAKGRPTHSWDTVLGAHELASKKLSKLAWVADWLKASPDHDLELHLLGNTIGESDFDLDYFIKPLWAQANFRGKPMYSLLARFGRSGWAHLVFSDEENRALLLSVNQPDSSRPHEIDRTDVYWHPKGVLNESSSKYAVIYPDGRIEAFTFLPSTP